MKRCLLHLSEKYKLKQQSDTITHIRMVKIHDTNNTKSWYKSCPALVRPGSSVHDSPGKYTGVGCHFLLQGIFQTQGVNLHLLPWQVDSLPLSHQGSPHTVFTTALFIIARTWKQPRYPQINKLW